MSRVNLIIESLNEAGIRDIKGNVSKYGIILGVKVGEKISDKQTIKLASLFWDYYNNVFLEEVIRILEKQNMYNERDFYVPFNTKPSSIKSRVEKECKSYNPNEKWVPQEKLFFTFPVPLFAKFGVEDIERILRDEFPGNLIENREKDEEYSKFPWYQPVKIFYRKLNGNCYTVGTEFRYYPEYTLKVK